MNDRIKKISVSNLPTKEAPDKFVAGNAEVIGVEVDSHFTHMAWENTPVDRGGIGDIEYPLETDVNKDISRDCGVMIDGSVALRGCF